MDNDNTENNSEVYNHYLKLSLPTEEDFQRVFTDAELKELCLKHKCRVNMFRWNVVNDYRIAFTKSGRYQRWSEHHRLGMLAKAVNKKKPAILYDEEEILKIRKEEWDFQLKDNILSLNLWRRNELRSNSPRLVVTDSEDLDSEGLNKESISGNEFLTESQNGAIENEPSNEEFNQEVETEIEVHTTPKNGTPSTDSEDALLCDNFELESLLEEDEDSVDSTATVIINSNKQSQLPVQVEGTGKTLLSEEINPAIKDLYDVDTMSMSINSQMYTQSQELFSQQSQNVIPESYDDFKNIPSTSTQSQNQEWLENVQ